MKISIEITAHVFFWTMFTVLTFVYSKIYLEAVPNARFAPHLNYVVFLELVMGLIFFYTTFFDIPWAKKKQSNLLILSAILLGLLLVFAYPAMQIGMLQILSSLIPHVLLIFLAILFRFSLRA